MTDCRDPEFCQQDGIYQCGCMNQGEEMRTQEEIVRMAAIRVSGEVWALPSPARHHILIMAWCWAHYSPPHSVGRIEEHEQGFLTSTGRFVDREEAACIATAADQILPRYKGKKIDNLTTEHLW